MSGAARVGGNVAALMGARLLSVVFSLVQASIIVSSLGRVGMGHFSYAWGLTSLLTVFATLGMRRVLVRDLARETQHPWALIWTATALVFALSLVTTAVLLLAEWGFDDNAPRRAAVVMAALWIIVLWAWQQPFEALLMARERMVLTGVLQVSVAALKLASVYWFLSTGSSGAEAHGALVLANAVGLVLFAGAAVRVEGWSWPRFDSLILWRIIRECRPMMAAMLLSMIYFKSDIVLLGWLRGADATGIYGAVQRIAEPVMMMAGVLGTALYPTLCRYSLVSENNHALLRRTSARLVLLLSMPMAFGLAAVADPVIALLAGDRASEFAASVGVLQLTCAVIPFFYLNGVVIEFLYAGDENWYVVKTYGLAAVVSVVGNLTLIPLAGVYAVPCVAIVVNMLITVFYYAKLRSVLREANLGSLVVRTLAACIVMGGVAWYLASNSLFAAVLAGAVVYPLAQLMLGTLSPLERQLAGSVAGRITGQSRPD